MNRKQRSKTMFIKRGCDYTAGKFKRIHGKIQ